MASKFEPIFNELIAGKVVQVPQGKINANSLRTSFYRFKRDAGISKFLKNKRIDIIAINDKLWELKLVNASTVEYTVIESEETENEKYRR